MKKHFVILISLESIEDRKSLYSSEKLSVFVIKNQILRTKIQKKLETTDAETLMTTLMQPLKFILQRMAVTADMYARMAKEAREEGFDDIADTMEGVLAIEKTHEQRYVALLNNIEDGSVFEKSEETLWECLNCGHLHKGSVAPEVCPVCDHPKAYFEVHLENY